jgi:hypothetical protein
MEWQDDDEDSGDLLSAVVIGHSSGRGEVLRRSRQFRLERKISDVAHLFTGPVEGSPFLTLACR